MTYSCSAESECSGRAVAGATASSMIMWKHQLACVCLAEGKLQNSPIRTDFSSGDESYKHFFCGPDAACKLLQQSTRDWLRYFDLPWAELPTFQRPVWRWFQRTEAGEESIDPKLPQLRLILYGTVQPSAHLQASPNLGCLDNWPWVGGPLWWRRRPWCFIRCALELKPGTLKQTE